MALNKITVAAQEDTVKAIVGDSMICLGAT
jgi:hypothetical protein